MSLSHRNYFEGDRRPRGRTPPAREGVGELVVGEVLIDDLVRQLPSRSIRCPNSGPESPVLQRRAVLATATTSAMTSGP